MRFFRALLLLLMAIAVDSRQTGTSSAGGSSLSWSHTVGAISNGILIVAGAEASGSNFSISGVNWDDSGTPVALTRKGRINDSAVTGWAEWWYLLAPKAGTFTIKTTNTGSCACTSGSASYSGVDQTTPFNAASPQSATGTTNTATVNITSAVGELVVDSVSDNENAPDTLVVGGGQTTIYNITNGTNNAGASSEENGAASVTMSWTGFTLSAPWAIIGVSMRPANPAVARFYDTRRAPGSRGPYDRRGFLKQQAWNFFPPPSVSSPFTLTPDVGSLVLTGFAPTIGTPVTVVPGFGSLVLTGFAPQFPTTLTPGFGQLVLTGFAPTIGVPVTVVPGFGSLVLSGFAPTFPRTIIPGFGQLILSGFAPTFPQTLLPGVGSLVLSGFAPSFSFVAGSFTLQPGVGSLVLTGFAPTLGRPITVVPGVGSLVLTGFAPVLGVPVTVRPGLGQLTLTGFEPAFSFTVLQLLRAIAQSDAGAMIFYGRASLGDVASSLAPASIFSTHHDTISLDPDE